MERRVRKVKKRERMIERQEERGIKSETVGQKQKDNGKETQ